MSRDIAELGLVKAPRSGGHAYVAPESLGHDASAADERLVRVLESNAVTVARSGLTLVLRGPLGSAQALALAIDESNLQDQLGTLAGDDTVLVLFGDEERLQRWRARFRLLQGLPPEPG